VKVVAPVGHRAVAWWSDTGSKEFTGREGAMKLNGCVWRWSGTLLAAFTVLAACGSRSRADFIVTNLATGFDNSTNALLPNGATDTKFVFAPGGTAPVIASNPVVQVSPLPITYLPDAASAASRWDVINSGQGQEGIDVAPGTYVFQTVVNLTSAEALTARIVGLRYAADNSLILVTINGTTVFSQPIVDTAKEFESFHDIGDVGLALFRAGSNTIEFTVNNAPVGPTAMGLRVEGEVTSAVPEPSSFLLTGAGLTALLSYAFGYRRGRGRRSSDGSTVTKFIYM
jgi:hypothetical protein